VLDSCRRDSVSVFLYLGFAFVFLFVFELTPASDSLHLTTRWLQGPSLLNQFTPNTVGTREAVCPGSHLSWASWAQVGQVCIPGLGTVARGMRSTDGMAIEWCGPQNEMQGPFLEGG